MFPAGPRDRGCPFPLQPAQDDGRVEVNVHRRRRAARRWATRSTFNLTAFSFLKDESGLRAGMIFKSAPVLSRGTIRAMDCRREGMVISFLLFTAARY